MTLTSTVLFGRPQQEIASLLLDRMNVAATVSIVSGFATPGGLATIEDAFVASPMKLRRLVIGAATYPGFEVLDRLLAAGVPPDRLFVHLGHSAPTGTPRNPFARYHPMLHSKIYYMESADSRACAFIGSHNLTVYALNGLNGEASVLLEGPVDEPQLALVRSHIDAVERQAVTYAPNMKEAYAWWTREYIDGLKAEMGIPQDWQSVRTFLLFAQAAESDRPRMGDYLYFEIPAGIDQIETLKTETHLFLFETLPASPQDALAMMHAADARYVCKTVGAENQQGNRQVDADWCIEETPRPTLRSVPGRTLHLATRAGKQQVRVEVGSSTVEPFEYSFERERTGWDPRFSVEDELTVPGRQQPQLERGADLAVLKLPPPGRRELVLKEMRGGNRVRTAWRLVDGLLGREGRAYEKDQEALDFANPESGSFILVSLRRRRRSRSAEDDSALL